MLSLTQFTAAFMIDNYLTSIVKKKGVLKIIRIQPHHRQERKRIERKRVIKINPSHSFKRN